MCAASCISSRDGTLMPSQRGPELPLTCWRKDADLCSVTLLSSEVTPRPVGASPGPELKPHRAFLIGPPWPTGFPRELHGSGSKTLRKWARSAGPGDGQMASPSCMNNSLFTKRVIFLMLFQKHASRGTDFAHRMVWTF